MFVDTIFFIFFKINKININIEKLNNKITNKFKKNELNIFFRNKNFFKIKNYVFKKTNNFYYLNILFENFCFFFKNNNKIILVLKKINNYYIKHNNYFLMKFLKKIKLDSYQIFFLRKNRVFNKGRYSRNRQNFRTGVYWCLYVNILAVLGIYYFFYKFTINFGYLW